jgi:aminocarboxymuconate-semialdehyde decarboxylase
MGDDDPLGLVAQMKRLPRASRDLIVGGNAARLLKLKL